MKLAINIIAMLIAFTALIALVNYLLGLAQPGLTLQWLFGQVFAPVAVLMGVDPADVPKVGGLLGVKLVGNEFLAFDFMAKNYQPGMVEGLSGRSYALTSFALTGFANLSSIGIQLGGIGALPRDPGEQASLRARLARLGPRALLGGFLATLINAAVAGVFLE
jgi:CNT family concentrative nucleoside transporter